MGKVLLTTISRWMCACWMSGSFLCSKTSKLKKGAVGQKENQGDVMRVSSIDPVSWA